MTTMSAKVSTVAFEGELNSIVREYLEFGDYSVTLTKFDEECADRGKPVAVLGNEVKSNEKLSVIQRQMMAHFDAGNRRTFLELWNENLPENIRDEDSIAQKLVFYLNIYFATYPTREGREKYECDEAMQKFKQYIESTGAALSQTTEFLPFYALPFVPNPKTHPTYRDIYTDTWIDDLKMRTDKFLALAFQSSPQPKLFELYSISGGGEDLQNKLRALQQQVYDSEKRAMNHMRRNNKVQADYHNLIGITAELVDALENTVHGKAVTPEYLQQICTRLFSSQTKFATQSVDLSRPGTAASVLRASVAPKNDEPIAVAKQPSPRKSVEVLSIVNTPDGRCVEREFTYPEYSDRCSDSRSTVRSRSSDLRSTDPGRCSDLRSTDLGHYGCYSRSPSCRSYPESELLYCRDFVEQELDSRLAANLAPGQIAPLDYDKVKKELAGDDEHRIGLLLQALRWRMTKSQLEQREAVISGYIANDILGCSQDGPHRETILNLLSSESEVNRQYIARLFNAMASVSSGRTYLSMNPELLKSLIHCLKSEEKDSIGLENVLGCLQKLSLKRTLQTAMIKEDIISWLVQVLEDHDSLSDYTLEYSIALLMNLCLRTQGKKQCVPIAGKTLKMLTDLLGHDNQEILPYVNGTLYSILAISSIRDEAKTMDMEDMLQCFIKEDQPDMKRQLKFIIKQLNSTDEPEEVESDDEDDEEDEDDEQDSMEADLDKAEVLKAQPSELCGEPLLATNYSAPPPTAAGRRKKQLAAEMPLNRPTTPGQRRAEVLRTDSRASDSAQMPPPTERPPTRTGSRPGTAESQRSSDSNGKEKKEKDPAAQAKRLTELKNPEYKAAFGSRPKIPRTPEVGGGRPTSRGSLTDSAPLVPQYSDGLPRSRPSSAGGGRSNGNNSPSTSRPTSRGQNGR